MRARNCLMFLTQLTRCHCALSQSAWVTPAQATDPQYWVDHLRGTVRFADRQSDLGTWRVDDADGADVDQVAFDRGRREAFGLHHPGGKLGMSLQSVRDWMGDNHAPPATVPADAGFTEVVSAITEGRKGAVAVLDSDGRLSGIVTDGDVRRAFSRDLDGLTAADIMMSFPLEAAAARAGAKSRPMVKAFLDRIHARPAYHDALKKGGPYDYAS